MAKKPTEMTETELRGELRKADRSDKPETGYGGPRMSALRAELLRRETEPGTTPADWRAPGKPPAELSVSELDDAVAQGIAAIIDGPTTDKDQQRWHQLRTEQIRRQDARDAGTLDALATEAAGQRNEQHRNTALAQVERQRRSVEEAQDRRRKGGR